MTRRIRADQSKRDQDRLASTPHDRRTCFRATDEEEPALSGEISAPLNNVDDVELLSRLLLRCAHREHRHARRRVGQRHAERAQVLKIREQFSSRTGFFSSRRRGAPRIFLGRTCLTRAEIGGSAIRGRARPRRGLALALNFPSVPLFLPGMLQLIGSAPCPQWTRLAARVRHLADR